MNKVRAQAKNLNYFLVSIFVFTILNAISVFAGPSRTTYQAKIVKPDGYPLEASSVNFKFTILDPAGSCILYSETYSAVNMSGTGGLISFALGSGVKTYPASATTFENVFSNVMPSLSCDAGGPPSYSPASSDIRKIVMQFHDGTGWQTLPAMSINAVPYAMYANDTLKLNGKTDADFVHVTSVPTCAVSEALHYNGAMFSCVTTGDTLTSSAVVSALGYTPATGASYTAVTSDIFAVSSTVAGVSNYASSVSATVTSLQNSVAASFAAITSSQWNSITSGITYIGGNVGVGTTTPVATLDVSGGIRIGVENVTCAANYAGTLRYISGNVEYCNGSTWTAFGVSGAGLQSLNGSTSGTHTLTNGVAGTAPAFNTANGVHTLNIPLASAGSVTAGLISNADYQNFSNKITSSAASVAQVLGYTPASATALASYLVKASNLSDLTDAVAARNNLGLGTFATANSLDLGSVSATGTLAIARLPSFTGDATIAAASNTIILANSGVGAGTYAKVTVDSKGRVTSGAQLTNSDVTTALGYTPANSATVVSSQWTTSGSAIYYNSGNVGVGTAAPAAKFSVNGSALIGGSTMNYTGTASAAILVGGSPQIVFDGGATSLSRLQWNGGILSFGKCQDSTCGPMSPYLDINTTTNITTFYNMNAVRAGNGYGTATAPTFSFGGTTNAGMFNPSAGTLSFATSGAERVRITSAGTVGVGTTNPQTALDVSGGVRIGLETATCATSLAGTLRYNAGNVEYCNGTTWTAFGVSGAGLQSFNGSTSGTQNFAIGTAGNAPAFNTSNGVHTLNIPLASAGSVTAGLLSNADYTTFSNKITSSAAAISQVLGYVPASATALGNYLVKANNLSDVSSASAARTNLGVGYIGTLSSVDLGSSDVSGTLAIARTSAYSGDVTKAAASNTLILSNTGVTAGTYTKVTVDSKGRVTSSSALASSDVTTALGYTPAASGSFTSSQWVTSGTTINYSTGNVGIGTAAPINLLHTHASAGNTVFRMSNASTGTTGSDGFVIQQTASDVNFINYETGAMAFQTSASERMRVTSAGAVGIGITTPGSKLVVKGSGSTSATSALNVTDSANNSALYVSDDGNIGINTVAPTGVIDIKGSGQAGPNNSASFNLLRLGNASALDFGEYAGGLLWMQASTRSNYASKPGLVINPDGGNVGIGTTAPTVGLHAYRNTTTGSSFGSFNTASAVVRIQEATGNGLYLDGNSILSDMPGYFMIGSMQSQGLVFGTSDTERLRIDAVGNIGIGTTAPTAKLEIVNSMSSSTEGILLKDSTTTNGKIAIGDATNGASSYVPVMWGKGEALVSGNRYGLMLIGEPAFDSTSDAAVVIDARFNSAAVASSPILKITNYNSEKMRIDVNGNVGIGTTAPSAKFEVSRNFNGESNTTAAFIGGYDAGYTNTGAYFVQKDNTGLGSSSTLLFNVVKNSASQFAITGTGAVGIGTTSPIATLHVAGTGYIKDSGNSLIELLSRSDSAFNVTNNSTTKRGFSLHHENSSAFMAQWYYCPSGACTQKLSFDYAGNMVIAGTLTQSSDIRLKKDILPLQNSLDKILSLNGVSYYWKDKEVPERQVGLIAQEVEKVFPEIIKKDEKGFLSVGYQNLVAPLIESMKELYHRLVSVEQKQIEQQREMASVAESKADKSELEKIKAENAALKAYICSKDPKASICLN